MSTHVKTNEPFGSYSIRADRLMHRHEAIAACGATGRGGVIRPALSSAETQARRILLELAGARGFQCSVDAIGNLFVRREGTDPDLPPLRTGSHLDSQMPGGNYDGVYGVLAAFEVMEALEDNEVSTRHPIELVIWNNEEGCRFNPTTMGSAVHAGVLSLEQALQAQDKEGICMADALRDSLEALPALEVQPLGTPAAGYLEAHIEQGPLLEANRIPLGIVTSIQGIAQFRITIFGEEAHAGTTPRYLRRDAFQYALRLIEELTTHIERFDDAVRFTVGACTVLPGAINTVPSKAEFTIDLRHPDPEVLKSLTDVVAVICDADDTLCKVTREALLWCEPVSFDAQVVQAIRETAPDLTQDIVSGATHDAAHIARLCPTGMVFIPCRQGISHNEAEYAEPAHMVMGCEALYGALLRLDQQLNQRKQAA